MRILVTGSRDWTDIVIMAFAMIQAGEPAWVASDVTLVHGGARGADTLADEVADALGWLSEPHRLTRADWDRDGKVAGHIRNQAMVSSGADICLAFVMPCAKPKCTQPKPHDSHGTVDCITRARRAGIPVRVYRPRFLEDN